MLEPVKATVHLPFDARVSLLDHDGAEIKETKNIKNQWVIDGHHDQTPFYLIRK